MENQIPMLLKKSPQLCNDQPVVQIMKEAHTPPVCPLRNQSADSDEHLRGRGQAKTQGMELVDTTLKTRPNIRPRFHMDSNLEVCVFEVY